MPLQYADERNLPDFFRKPPFNREQSLSEAKTLPFHNLPRSLYPFQFHKKIWPPRFYLGCIVGYKDSVAIARAAGMPENKAHFEYAGWDYLERKIREETGIKIEVETVYNGPGQYANIISFGSNHLFFRLPKKELLGKAVVNVLGMQRQDLGWFLDPTCWRWQTADEIMSRFLPELYPEFDEEGADLSFPLTLSYKSKKVLS